MRVVAGLLGVSPATVRRLIETGTLGAVHGVERVPYRLPALLAAIEAGVVVLCKGEKDCDRLVSEGFTANTSAGGAANWKADYARWPHR